MITHMRSVGILTLASAFVWFSAPAARAAFTVFGNGKAQDCAGAARAEEKGAPQQQQALAACDLAIQTEDLEPRDLAGSYINRGILYIMRAKYQESKKDFDSAIGVMPMLGEAYVNRGAVLVVLGRYKEAIADIDQGLALNPGEPEKAYFNRGLAEEGLDDIQGAYRDYSHAAELKPNWVLPQNELARFTVAAPAS